MSKQVDKIDASIVDDAEDKKVESQMPKKTLLIGSVATLAIFLLIVIFVPNEHFNFKLLVANNDQQTEKEMVEISHYPMYENHPRDTFAQFLNFIAEHDKDQQYKTREEFNKRLAIFRKNYDRIVKYNRMEDAGFTLEINQFADLEDDEFVKKHASGIVISEERRKRVEAKHVEPDAEPDAEENEADSVVQTEIRRLKSIPRYKNWYKDGFVTRPYDQGACGGCWAFSTASAVESLAKIAGVDKELQEYSVQQLLDCDRDNYACTGGWMYQGFAYVSTYGILKKSDYYQYSQRKETCNGGKNGTNKPVHMKDIGYVEHDRRNNAQLRELLQTQPLSTSVYSTGMFGAYKSGIFTEDFLHCSYGDREVNHGVVLVGYGKVGRHDRVRGRCKEYWIVRNSWGAKWGEEGFFRICADNPYSKKLPYGTCLINKYTVWPTMNKDDIDPDFEI